MSEYTSCKLDFGFLNNKPLLTRAAIRSTPYIHFVHLYSNSYRRYNIYVIVLACRNQYTFKANRKLYNMYTITSMYSRSSCTAQS